MPMLSVEKPWLLLTSVLRLGISIGFHGERGFARLEVPQQQLVLQLVVAGRLGERDLVLLHVGQAHAEVVGLHALVARAFLAGRAGMHARQQAARLVALLHVGIDAG